MTALGQVIKAVRRLETGTLAGVVNIFGGCAIYKLMHDQVANNEHVALVLAMNGTGWAPPLAWQGLPWLCGYFLLCVLMLLLFAYLGPIRPPSKSSR